MPKLKERAIHEGKTFAAIFLYLYIVLGLFNLHEYIVLKQHDIDFTRYGFALVNALALAKVVLVADALHLGRHFEKYRLIYSILAKALLFAIVLTAFNFAEKVIIGLWRGKTLVESVPSIGGGGLVGIIIVAAITCVALIPFFAFRAIMRALGGPQLHSLLFSRQPENPLNARA